MPDNLNYADGNSAVFEVFFDDLEYIRDTLNWIQTLKRRPTPIQFERTRAGEYPWVNMDVRGMGRPEFVRMPNYTEHPFTIFLDVWVFAGERDPEAIIYRNPDTPTLTEGLANLCDKLVNRLMTQFHDNYVSGNAKDLRAWWYRRGQDYRSESVYVANATIEIECNVFNQ